MAKSYFAILGISSSASRDEVRSAYRRLAKEFHPDHYEGDSAPFRQIQEAYAILGNDQQRRQYEKSLVKPRMHRTSRRSPHPEPEPLIPERGISEPYPAHLDDISPIRSFDTFSPSFDEVFDWLWDNFSSLDRPKSGRIQRLTLEVPLSKDQALAGGNARIMVPARAMCPTCRGHGAVGVYECFRCAGEGAIFGEMPVSISFPSGLTQDHTVVVPLARFGIRNMQLTVMFRPRDI